MEPWFEGGFDVTLQLPHNGFRGIANPLYSQTVATYLRQTWMTKFSLWSFGIIKLIETGMGMQIEANNQFSESLFKNVKHNTDVYDHVSDPGDYIIHRYEDSDRCTKQFVHQYETVHGKIQELMSRRSKRNRAVHSKIAASTVTATATLLSQDEVSQQAEEALSEPWSRPGSSSEIENKLRNELVETFREHIEDVGRTSFKRQHNYLEGCVGAKQISYPTFLAFMMDTRKSTSGLSIIHRQVLQEFVNEKKKET
jgi:hypothetical protein